MTLKKHQVRIAAATLSLLLLAGACGIAGGGSTAETGQAPDVAAAAASPATAVSDGATAVPTASASPDSTAAAAASPATAVSDGATAVPTASASPATATAVPAATASANPAPADTATPVPTATLSDTASTSFTQADDGTTRIVVASTTANYFVLYVQPDLSSNREIPVAIALGQNGSTVLTDGRQQLPEAHYRVETLSVADPGDADADGIDDLTELNDSDANPLNAAKEIVFSEGTVLVEDRATFEALSYQGNDVARDSYLAGLEFVKFYLVDTDTATPKLYFMNTENYRAHPQFAEAIGLNGGDQPQSERSQRGPRPQPGQMRGDIVYNPQGIAPDGTMGTYRFAFQPNDAYPFDDIALAFEIISSAMPFLTDNLLYEPYPTAALPLYEREKATYDAYRVPILLNE